MPLNNSGPLSFGGSTVGQSINLELGLSATATASINSTAFRTLAGVSSGQISVSNFYGKSNVTYFGLYVNNVSTRIGITQDPSGNVYMMYYEGANGWGQRVKVSPTGSITQATFIYGSTANYVTSNGVVYITSTARTLGAGESRLIGYENDGSQYNRGNVSTSGRQQTSIFSIKTNNAQTSLFVSGVSATYTCYTSTVSGFVASTDFAINSTWARSLMGPLGTQQPFEIGDIAVDASNNIYAWSKGRSSVSGANTTPTITKLNSSGTLQLARTVDSSGDLYETNGITYDPVNDVLYGIATLSNAQATYLLKYNTSGSLLWSRKILPAGSLLPRLASVCTDTSGNIYASGYTSGVGNRGLLYVKYNSSGTLQWQRVVTYGNGNMEQTYQNRALISTDGALVMQFFTAAVPAGEFGGSQGILKVPTDGSKTGTYDWSGRTLTIAASTFPETNAGLTVSNSNMAVASSGALSSTLNGGTSGSFSPTSSIIVL